MVYFLYPKKGHTLYAKWKKKEAFSYFLDKEYDSSKDIGAKDKRVLEAQIGISGKTLSEAIGFLMDFYDLEIKDVTDRPEDRCSLSYRQFQRYKNGEVKNPSKRVVIAICLSMKLPFTISCTVCLPDLLLCTRLKTQYCCRCWSILSEGFSRKSMRSSKSLSWCHWQAIGADSLNYLNKIVTPGVI